MPVPSLSACDLGFVAELLQNFCHALSVFPLDFYHAIFNRPTCAAFLFEFLGESLQVFFGEDKVLHNGYHLPSPTARLAMQIGGLLLWRQGPCMRRRLFFLALVTIRGRPDSFIISHGAIIAKESECSKKLEYPS